MSILSDVLLIEPFYGGSHRQLMDLLHQKVPGSCMFTLPAKKWHWRARTSALYFSQIIPQSNYRVLFASSVLNLAELVALRPDLARLKKIVYFHENQLIYPVRKHQDRDFQYGYNQILSCLVADVVVFNSQYNQESFLNSIGSFVKLIPDHRPKGLQDLIRPKCMVLYFPLNFPSMNTCSQTFMKQDIATKDLSDRSLTQTHVSSSCCIAADHISCTGCPSNTEHAENCNNSIGKTTEISGRDCCSQRLEKDGRHDQSVWQNRHGTLSVPDGEWCSSRKNVSKTEMPVCKTETPVCKTETHVCKTETPDMDLKERCTKSGDSENAHLHMRKVCANSERIQQCSTCKAEIQSFSSRPSRSYEKGDCSVNCEESQGEVKCTGPCVERLKETNPQNDQGILKTRLPVADLDQGRKLHIVWAHRWEHDKDPETLFLTLFKLHDDGCEFSLSVLGENYSEIPAIFEEAHSRLSSHIQHWGYLPSKADFWEVLGKADVAVSTAIHEFFGVSMLEAVHAGCFPLCPNRLVYPEIFPKCYLYNTATQLYKMLKEFCKRPEKVRKHKSQVNLKTYMWENLGQSYQELLSS